MRICTWRPGSNYHIIGTNALRADLVLFLLWNGAFLATMFFLPLGLFMENKTLLGKLAFPAEMVVILTALLFTYSNGSWIALLSGVFAFCVRVGSRRYRLLWIAMIAMIAILILLLFTSQLAVQLHTGPLVPYELPLRIGGWQERPCIRVMEAYPLFGVGLGSQAYLIRAESYCVPGRVYTLTASA